MKVGNRTCLTSAVWTCAVLLACATYVLAPQPAFAQTPGEPVIYLDQGWSQAERQWYYQFSQGSAVLSYDIFLNLEVADGQELFRSDANSERWGLIPNPANPGDNPDGLPIGLSKTVISSPRFKGDGTGEFIGLTCAACHNAQLNYQGKRIRIDGGVGNMLDYMGYVQALDDAMQATLKDPAKYDRLATRLKATAPDAKARLRKRFESEAATVHQYRTRYIVTPNAWGPSRMDAVAMIVNRLAATLTGIPENLSTGLAPSKQPFLWNATQGLWTQWRASEQNPIFRNFGETSGVFLPIDLHSTTPAEGLFESSTQIANLQAVENLLDRLAPPKWPEEVFGKIDRDKAQAGKALFVELCASCHNVWPYRWTEPNKYGKQWVIVGLTPQSYVGTDPGQFEDLRPYAITGQLAPYLPGSLKDKESVPTGELLFALISKVYESALAKHKYSEADYLNLIGYRELPIPRLPENVYKAAPRDGVWATPPFMHNGSVPNLYEMLLPANERTKKFYVGREFDPVKVGLDTSGKSGKQRWTLVEYLKSIPEEAGRVAPFGGPAAAQAAKPGWTAPR